MGLTKNKWKAGTMRDAGRMMCVVVTDACESMHCPLFITDKCFPYFIWPGSMGGVV